MTTAIIFERLGLALAIGLLIGIERGWQEREGKPGSRAAGIRTFALIGLLGGIWGLLAPLAGSAVLGLAFLGFAGALTLFEWQEMRSAGSYSATGTVAGLLAFALGAYAVLGNTFAAASAAVAATFILAERRVLHEFLEQLKWTELRAGLLLLVMTVVLLPVLPNRTIDPWGALNPFQIWLMTVLIAAMSFGGYIAVKAAGARNGLLYAGAAGGIVSSTTVTWTFAQLARLQRDMQAPFVAGITASWTVSVVRVLVILAVISPSLAMYLFAPLTAAIAAFGAVCAFCYRRAADSNTAFELSLRDPFEIMTVLGFGGLLAGVMLASRLLASAFGKPGVLGLASLSGLADVDPVTLAMGQAVGHGFALDSAALAVLIALAANTVAKCALAAWFGGRRLATALSLIAVVSAAITLAVFLIAK